MTCESWCRRANDDTSHDDPYPLSGGIAMRKHSCAHPQVPQILFSTPLPAGLGPGCGATRAVRVLTYSRMLS